METIKKQFLEKLIDFLPTLVTGVLVFVIGLLIVKIIVALISKALTKSKFDQTAHGFLISLVTITLKVIVIVISLSTLGIPMTTIVTVIGAAGLAISLAIQDSLKNLSGGFIILFSKPFKIGDFIECEGVSGSVNNISILYTRLLTPDNKAIYIPNGQVTTAKLINYNDEPIRRLDLYLSIAYENDFNKAINIIKDTIYKNEFSILDPEPVVRVSKHDASGITITARVWVASENYFNLSFDLHEQIKTAFDENNIVIPFNQLDVHIIEK